MNLLRLSLIVSSVLLLAQAASAQDQLIQSKGCLGCHDVTQTKMGPSFHDIAAKYKGQTNAAATITNELKTGNGHPMKANASDAELQQIVTSILATP